MRSSRRGGHGGMEFGGSGEDSFVAVVVTKLTGALLFILLLTMVIMALIPKAVDLPAGGEQGSKPDANPLAIATPETLPEAIESHPYVVALAATGGNGAPRWSVDGALPAGLNFDPSSGQIRGTPRAGTAKPAALVLRVGDSDTQVSRPARLVVYQSDKPLTTPAWWKPGIPPVPWRAWLEQGFGFLVLWLVYLVSMNAIARKIPIAPMGPSPAVPLTSASISTSSAATTVRPEYTIAGPAVRSASCIASCRDSWRRSSSR